MADPRPLWEVMETAYKESSGTFTNYLDEEELPGPDREEFSAMIRAVRDWILLLPNGYDWSRMQAEALARVLTAEAARAERGETINPSENDFDA